jgi:proprotein convertase subtilisin/kexin type 5
MNTSTRCTTCIQGLFYQDYACLSVCPPRSFPVLQSMTCLPCQLPCFNCSSPTTCVSCSYNYLLNGNCIADCPEGYYENIGVKKCNACLSSCKTCQIYG